ncbi:MAG: hypothetical protein IPG90_08565 [Bacteroidetes bacterium]|jgi:hypothetical protein|nr:hypothetical protein [Bacteroidota bacterium]MBK9526256.1 hypothetical protein [Bacteroidota bacterium]MBK9544160.1 hypothetical protein [Bacteroidota bacterium]MBP6402180.1 hypothetical protein [Bacteroidia bacterium]MBP6648493.1 hypothetical protein [Bacteroidia bacterium]
MSNTHSVSIATIQQWIAEKRDTQLIEEELSAQGHDPVSIESCIREFKKIKYGRRQSTGFTFLAIGAVLGFISCLLSILNPIPDLYYVILYGLTSIAVLLICAGLYYLLE